jgi:RND family efflux transporter MFP subunit
VLVVEGDAVEAGTVLIELDDARLRLELAANGAALAAARATVAEREAIAAREARNLDLHQRAATQGGTNPREMSDAESDRATAEAQASQARAAVEVIEEQGALLARRIADLSVRAPFDGRVIRRHAEKGAWVASGGAVLDLADTQLLEGWFDLPQELFAQAAALAKSSGGAAVDAVEIRTSNGDAVRGASLRVVPDIDERSRTFHAIVVIPNDSGVLAPGLALTAFVPQGAPQKWTLVPKDAIVYQGTNATVYMVQNGTAVPVQVRVAFPVGDRVALDGAAIPLGAQVVTEGNERLMPMTPVSPVGSAAEGRK